MTTRFDCGKHGKRPIRARLASALGGVLLFAAATAVTAAAAATAVTAATAATAATAVLTAPAAGAVSDDDVPSCTFADTTDGVLVSWSALPADADVVAIERSVDRGTDGGTDGVTDGETAGGTDGATTFEERDRTTVDREQWLDGDLAGLVPDADVSAPLEMATSANQYRIVLIEDDDAVLSVPCTWDRGNTGRFACSVTMEDEGDLVEWVGGPTGPGLDYVVERFVDRGEGSQFHWRARRFDRSFLDAAADRLPTYRVTARFERAEAVSVECGMAGVMSVRAPDAAFVCPVPPATFVDTFGADRDGGARRHLGVDMFAPVGTPVLAPEAGELVFFWNELGGQSFGLYAESGTFYYGAHLDTVIGGDRWVVAGEPVGTVGTTGNARTTPPHLHFQIHPEGRRTPAANPTAATAVACR